jgi:integrase
MAFSYSARALTRFYSPSERRVTVLRASGIGRSASQAATLIEAVRGHRIFVPVVMAAMCGLRRGEIAALRWCHVDLDNGTLSVVQSAEQTRAGIRYAEPKRGRTRNVALSGNAVEELRAWRVQQAQELLRLGARATDETLICTTAAGDGIQPNSLTHAWQKAIAGRPCPESGSTICGIPMPPTCSRPGCM